MKQLIKIYFFHFKINTSHSDSPILHALIFSSTDKDVISVLIEMKMENRRGGKELT